jgi:ribose transport system permease protein
MQKTIVLGILVAALGLVTYLIEPSLFSQFNLDNLARRSALLGIYAIGVGVVIIAGGIDLSIGSVVAFTGYLTVVFAIQWNLPPLAVIPLIGALGLVIGLIHGVLIAHLKLPPFVATLCGLLVYRGLARVVSGDNSGGIGESQKFIKSLAGGHILGIPLPVWILCVVGVLVWLFLTRTVWGRYIYAIGNNEEAVLYSGINVARAKILTYVVSGVLAAFSGLLEVGDVGSVTPAGTGTFYELYAIAAAVLGGCSLRGGEGTVSGITLGAVMIRLIGNVTNLLGIPSQFEYVVLGMVILAGALIDVLLERYRSREMGTARRT